MRALLSYSVLLTVLALSVASCEKVAVFEKNEMIPGHQWSAGFKPSVQFNIDDSTSRYNLFVVLRHSDAYRYNNLWVNIHTTAPGDSAAKVQALDLTLANNEKGWLGTGMDDIYEHRIRITQDAVTLKKGLYQFQLEQIMRDDPLANVYNVGIRVEKANP
ncbi:gliding motility lipoprotein GldH [Flavihumibacter petaseus]|uniref:Gliding motility lipoprotein GldH n=1 Tax=Flavihumibacter petaseus NBRC 106054 TaxID=1220578 RepID=A0A0E9MZR5_9BACT|nr:gliding motility lipoprotein GldH [Flavihumibacter petaseus]GAO42866.1 hypothetical protein FPE01S_01_18840 [Flavihumibacter petaseus NBRC 106054]